MKIKTILAAALSLLVIAACNKDKKGGNGEPAMSKIYLNGSETAIAFHPGYLGDAILKEAPGTVTQIAIVGKINAADIGFMRKNWISTLQDADLKKMRLVKGGSYETPIDYKATAMIENETTLPFHSFGQFSALERVVLPDNLTEMDYFAFRYCAALKEVEFPSTLKILDNYSFYGCSSLKDLVLPKGVTEIHCQAFYQCKLETVDLPSTLNYLSDDAFMMATQSISKFIVRATVPPAVHHDSSLNWDYSAVKSQSFVSGGKIYVPEASISQYRGAAGWNVNENRIVSLEKL